MVRKSANTNPGLNNESSNIVIGSDPIANGNDSESGSDDNSTLGEGSSVINPGDIIAGSDTGESDNTDQPRKKRRGRPPGSKSTNRKSAKENSQDLGTILVGIHYFAAKMANIEELELEQDEAEKLGSSMQRVAELYTDYIVPEKVLAWGGLISTVASVYGPRGAAYHLRKKNEAKEKAAGKADAAKGVVIDGTFA